jgi:hypothetical protein
MISCFSNSRYNTKMRFLSSHFQQENVARNSLNGQNQERFQHISGLFFCRLQHSFGSRISRHDSFVHFHRPRIVFRVIHIPERKLINLPKY